MFGVSLSPEKNSKTHANIHVIKCDVRDFKAVNDCIDQILLEVGKIDALVNCAGIQQPPSEGLEHIDHDDWRNVLGTNLDGVFHLCKAVIPTMKSRREGVIINMASVAATDGYPMACAYATSKSALIGLTKSLAKELATYNVRVNAIMPSLTMTDAALGLPAETLERLVNLVPLGRIALPEDIAGVEFFLSSPDANYITGELFRVAGGR
ncbi:SDR family NAD(P)-dependent oxidoreductase [Pseudomonas chlororaphis]|uniref:SDR family NAD(P)-dependent oxidoreductase n=2 Tax=Pseudomonas chlororaphis TaxID=587753 RepID=UPI001B315DA5|nr:SDR family NAD(P)-dependent oxidoreductase [Pseudomonas chlororaphis]MBP5059766.1 SDR family oxidoreductase [Pseudomonas chlororaphis]MBP5144210.1 SDR family oxidoreductase [Pseudomonas chlororaphis]QTT98613.1 SDR family oxidoreductase [Pseudomonas chlororaphis]